jgi:hypothetical protein
MKDKPDPRKEDLIRDVQGSLIIYRDPITGEERITEETKSDGGEWRWEESQDAYGGRQQHRLGGPAGRFKDGRYEVWYYHGKQVNVKSQKEYEQWLRLKAFQ